MKKLLTCFFAIVVCAPSAIAADGAVSRVIPTGSNDAKVSTTSSRTTVSRVATRDANHNEADSKSSAGRTAASNVRATVSRVFSGANDTATPVKTIASRSGVVSRVNALTEEKSGRSALSVAVNTVGRNERVSSASINNNPSVRRAGVVLRPSTAEVGGRATIGNTGVQTGSNIDETVRGVRSRAATAETFAEATERLEQAKALNASCQAQYNECMDQFCSIVDANQKRCSCSENLTKYNKVETAVKDANVQLNEVAQRIRYVGLSADEIRAIMTETEAEEVLSNTKDTSETRGMLEEIEDLIRDPTVNRSSSYSASGDFGIDMDIDFSGDSSDLFSLDFLTSDDSNFANLRGKSLYNAAKKRCNSILNQCKEAGADTGQILGNYELAIDKDCVAYEQGLIKMNDTLLSNVRSANRMLQKARLTVLQNKNTYTATQCIGALETCMKDEMVCGDNYFKCVDPTKRYIDENGEVVIGQDISDITAFMQHYNNAQIGTEFLNKAYSNTVMNVEGCKTNANDGSCVAKYLLTKIGTKQKVTDEGLCRAVLDKCQNYTYDKNGNYMPYNDIVINYVQRAMVNIRAAQQRIISDYASECMVDISDCYNQQVSQVNSWSSTANVGSIYKVMRGACRNVALTCAYAVFDGDDLSCPEDNTDTCITNISELFYQSMLCPEYSTFMVEGCDSNCVNDKCGCQAGYAPSGGACIKQSMLCPEYSTFMVGGCNDSGVCVNDKCKCQTGYAASGGACIKKCSDGQTLEGGVCKEVESDENEVIPTDPIV